MTPWGLSDTRTQYADGIAFYSTPSHGGFQLSDERLAQLRAVHGDVHTYCGQPHWFEEDCDWAYVATAFPDLFTDDELTTAKATLAWNLARADSGETGGL
jgi:hypothetical protein